MGNRHPYDYILQAFLGIVLAIDIIGLPSHLRRREPTGKPCDGRCHYGTKTERARHRV